MERILVVMLRRIGDVILTTPAVRALRKAYPKARIDFLVEPPAHQVLSGNQDVDRVLIYGAKGVVNYVYWLIRIRAERYDCVIDFMGNPRSAMLSFASRASIRLGPGRVSHRWAYNRLWEQPQEACYSATEKILALNGLGISPDLSDPLPRMTADADSEEWSAAALRRMRLPRSAPVVGLVPASRRETRRWPAASYGELGRLLHQKAGASVVVFWGPGERSLAEEVRREIGEGGYLAPETKDLRQLAALIGRCRAVVTNCNGPKHIAVARGVPTLTIHGSSAPECWNPAAQALHPVIRMDGLHCIGCQKNDCPYGLECMKDLAPQAVFEAADRLLREAGAAR